MRKQLCSFLFSAVCLLVFLEARATHIVGGELNYKYLGSDKYEIRMTIYRDCYVGRVGFDDYASVGIFNASNVRLFTLQMLARDSGLVPPIIYDPCTVPPLDFCYKYCHYIDTINLPPLVGGYQISYQRCCRNQNILNLLLKIKPEFALIKQL